LSTSVARGVDTREATKPAELLGKLNGVTDVSRSVAVCQRSVYLDFETRNTGGCDLKIAGVWAYATHPMTEILVLGYRSAARGEWCFWSRANGYDDNPLLALAADPAARFVCFGDFEMAIWAEIMVDRHGFPPIPLVRWDNGQATCAALALPRALGKVLPVI